MCKISVLESLKKNIIVMFLLFLSIFLVSCQPPQKPNKERSATVNKEWSEVILSHSGSQLGRHDEIRISFQDKVLELDALKKSNFSSLSISPELEGKWSASEENILIFKPNKVFEHSKEYVVSLTTAHLKSSFKHLSPFSFVVKVLPFKMSLTHQPFEIDEKLEITVKGQLMLEDHYKNEELEKILRVELDGKKYPIEFFPTYSSNVSYTIKGIEQLEKQDRKLEIFWDFSIIGIDEKGSKEIVIPKLSAFALQEVNVVQSSTPYVELTFTRPLKKKQNLKGLLRIKGQKVTYAIEKNRILVYPNKKLSGEKQLLISAGIKDSNGTLVKLITAQKSRKLLFDELKPQLKFVGKEIILPQAEHLEVAFDAVNLKAVDVFVAEIFPNKIQQFLQDNTMSEEQNIHYVSRNIWHKRLDLKGKDLNSWQEHSLDLRLLAKEHPGSIFRVTLKARPEYSIFSCKNSERAPLAEQKYKESEYHAQDWEDLSGRSYYYDDYYEDDQGDYFESRRDPCSKQYYLHNTNVSQTRNFFASNIGLIAKKGVENKLWVTVTELDHALALNGAMLEVTNFQGQKIGEGRSDANGFSQIEVSGVPYLLTAQKGEQRAYLKLNGGSVQQMSHFDTDGQKSTDGLRGYIYAERDVWRPGDQIFLTFALQDPKHIIKADHPVIIELYDPRGRKIQTLKPTQKSASLYSFKLNTAESAVTGIYKAVVKLGAQSFQKTLKIENIRPNRLKIDFNFPGQKKDSEMIVLHGDQEIKKVEIFSEWLHGASAEGLKVDVRMKIQGIRTTFSNFSGYSFDSLSRDFKMDWQTILETHLDKKGRMTLADNTIDSKSWKERATGVLKATFATRVYEPGGTFSIHGTSAVIHPFEHYVGIGLPKTNNRRQILYTDEKHSINIVSVDSHGKKTSRKEIKVNLYKVNWRWWWDRGNNSMARYKDKSAMEAVRSATLETKNGLATFDFNIEKSNWGRYLLEACDQDGHCSESVFYVDWPGWAERAQNMGKGAATRYELFSDKKAYKIGDVAKIQLPKMHKGRALLSLEVGDQILEQKWIILDGKREQIEIPITKKMIPNVYVSMSMIQAHQGHKADRAIRLFGTISLMVSDPQSHLYPQIESKKIWAPESEQKITISEKSGRAMSYTLAIVDEGLLGLTNFRTPDLFTYFNAKKALQVKTWDMFDDVVGAYGGRIDRMLAVGGGDSNAGVEQSSKRRRFPPIVEFLGPFHLEADALKEHSVRLKPYLGRVRIMVVAAEQSSYGKAAQEIMVKQDLMIQAALPRTLRTGEEVDLPVMLFNQKQGALKGEVSLANHKELSKYITVIGKAQRHFSFKRAGEQLVTFRVKVKDALKKVQIQFKAQAAGVKSHSEAWITIGTANAQSVRISSEEIAAGATKTVVIPTHGLKGSQKIVMNLSSLPDFNLTEHLNYLIRYPHGCLEQTTSAIFPQLFLESLTTLDARKKKKVQSNIKAAMRKYKRFQRSNGNFSYWPGGSSINHWTNVYAGHFLVESQYLGYEVPANLLNKWLKAQTQNAQNWMTSTSENQEVQAYRLYVLALAKKPEMSAMNRLRWNKKLNNRSLWFLAAAYYTVGEHDVARKMVKKGWFQSTDYQNRKNLFGSHLSELGQHLENFRILGLEKGSQEIIKEISAAFKQRRRLNTHALSWSLLALGHYYQTASPSADKISLQGNFAGEKMKIASSMLTYEQELDVVKSEKSNLELKNVGKRPVYLNILSYGIDKPGEERASAHGLSLQISVDGEDISRLDENAVKHGEDVLLKVSVRNNSGKSLQDMALTIPVTTGWEITDANYSDDASGISSSSVDYQDVRDDRIYKYFSLSRGGNKTFYIRLNAAFKGHFYMPSIHATSMYDLKVFAHTKGKWLTIASAGQ